MSPFGGRLFLKPIGRYVRFKAFFVPHPILKDLENLASETAAESGFDICSVQLLTHIIPITMQVQIRHMDGEDVSLDDCARLSKPMGEAIETSQLIDGPYVLEISSPGVSEELLTDKDFKTFRGFPVEVISTNKQNSEIREIGLLKERSKDHVHLNIKGKINRIPRDNVLRVLLTTQ